MSKRVLDVGQCGLDHGNIRELLARRFAAEVDQADRAEETIDRLRRQRYDLVLVNRLLDADGSEGLRLIDRLKADEELMLIPVMLVSNFPDCQRQAIEAGAEPGFGKADYESPAALENLSKFLA
ncbi:MAG: response regulator [Planctomycetales bacterium]